jgi:ParB-like chromosome segregation protein Spo0J
VGRTGNSSSSPAAEERLIRVPLALLHAHPTNANLMPGERRAKLARHIEREGRYPPLVVRPHPALSDAYQLLDGHQRADVLRDLGHTDALCFVWPCDDATALLLLATLNRLEGEDVPAKRAELIAELRAVLPLDELATLLPEDAAALEGTLALLDLDTDALLAQLADAAEQSRASAPRLISFAVLPDDELLVERAIERASRALTGPNRRGRALGLICRRYLEEDDE